MVPYLIVKVVKVVHVKSKSKSLLFSIACDCNTEGTVSCNKENGECICNDITMGTKCDTCNDGYYGAFPNCTGFMKIITANL